MFYSAGKFMATGEGSVSSLEAGPLQVVEAQICLHFLLAPKSKIL